MKEDQGPEISPGAQPEITPDMVHSVLTTLESEGLVHFDRGGAYIPTDKGWKLLRSAVQGKEVVTGKGHAQIHARDEDSFEITTEKTPDNEDNVICVSADMACKDMSENFKNALKTASKLKVTIEAGDEIETINAFGSPALTLTDENEIVIRKSDFIDGKTAGILSDKSANDFNRELKEKLKDPNTEVRITLELE